MGPLETQPRGETTTNAAATSPTLPSPAQAPVVTPTPTQPTTPPPVPAPTPVAAVQPSAPTPQPIPQPRRDTGAREEFMAGQMPGRTIAPRFSPVDAARAAESGARARFIESLRQPEDLTRELTELEDFRGAARAGIAGEEGLGRARPLALVRGRQAKLQEQAATEEQTRLARIGVLQGAQAAEQSAAEAALSFAKTDVQRELDDKFRQQQLAGQFTPFEFNGNLVQFDPATGDVRTVATGDKVGEAFTLGEGQVRFDAQGNVIARGPDKPVDIPTSALDEPLTVNQLQDLGIPTSMFGITGREAQGLLQTGLVTTPEARQQQQTIDSAQQKIDLVTDILRDERLDAVVGPTAINRIAGTALGAAQGLIGSINQLTSEETLNTLLNLKKQGGTLGALSQTELDILRQSANKIGSWAVTNRNGQVTGFAVSEKVFKEELERIRGLAQKAMREAGAPPPTTVDQLLRQNPQVEQEVEALQANGATDAEILELYFPQQPSFSGDLGTSQNGLGSLSARFESNGNPGAIGFDSTGGLSYGTYQLAFNNALNFIQQSRFADAFAGLRFNSQEFQNRWKEIAAQSPAEFEAEQHDYIKRTHFDPQVQKIAGAGFNIGSLPGVVRDVIWSTAVQHGPGNNIIVAALQRLGQNANPADLVRTIYDIRWSNGRNFASSTPQVQNAVFNRFFGQNGELNQALSRLA